MYVCMYVCMYVLVSMNVCVYFSVLFVYVRSLSWIPACVQILSMPCSLIVELQHCVDCSLPVMKAAQRRIITTSSLVSLTEVCCGRLD